MRVGIIGGGFTGLSAAFELTKRRSEVFLFEREKTPGGLALGYKRENWRWSLEEHYHHWFTNDKAILDLAKETEFGVLTERPKTSVFVQDGIYQLDDPLSLLTFPKLSFLQKLRMGATLAFLKANPFWQPLERYPAVEALPFLMGEKPFKLLWEPLFKNKFSGFYKDISLAWFWARIKKRTSSLSYPQGGFLEFAKHISSLIQKQGAQLFFETEVQSIEVKDDKVQIIYQTDKKTQIEKLVVDRLIVTVPSFVFARIAPQLPEAYKKKLLSLRGLAAMNLVLFLSKPFLTDNTYWLNICDDKFPFMSVVEHTNFIDKRYYNNEHIVYVGKYLENTHPFFSLAAGQLLKIYHPYLQQINPSYTLHTIRYELFKAPFAQPVIPLNYSRIVPEFSTPLANVYLANIQQVYPWDRGTNYAVELGKKVVQLIKR
jgi:protoporphyrinogen oxidase